jgi:lipopolysaccharide export system protein LptC
MGGDDLMVPDMPSARAVQAPRVYSWVVRVVRPLLVVLMLAVAAAVFLWPSMMDQTVPVVTAPDPALARNELVAPHFTSRDDQGRPFTIEAARATQDLNDANQVMIEAPSGTLMLEDQQTVKVTAQRGVYHRERQALALEGAVVVVFDGDYTLKTDRLDLDLNAGIMSAPGHVGVTGQAGVLKGRAMTGARSSDHLVIEGPATLEIYEGIL